MSQHNIAIVTLFPEMFEAITQNGVTGRAVKNDIARLQCFNPRDYADDKHKTVDDKSYGGGPGMVMKVEPLFRAIQASVKWMCLGNNEQKGSNRPHIIYMSPQGNVLNKHKVVALSEQQNLIIIAGRYEGIDERVIQLLIDEEYSIGDYVLSGGELPAMVLIDAMLRRIPGVVGDSESVEQDSFENGIFDHPHYTRPQKLDEKMMNEICDLSKKALMLNDVHHIENASVPKVLMSGDHKKIQVWRYEQALEKTKCVRPDLVEKLD